MRWFLGLLVLVNVAILVWGSLDEPRPAGQELATPGVGSIRLLGEKEAAPAPAAVPIPAPPRSDGVMPRSPVSAAISVPPVEPKPSPAAEESNASAEMAEATVEPAEPMPQTRVSEQDSAPEQEKGVAPEIPAKPSFCSRIGPFANVAATQLVADYLKGRGGQVDVSNETRSMHAGYWVMVPPQQSRDAAEAVGRRLKAKGIKDYWVIPKGEFQFGISLGVFSQQPNAVRFAERARKKGFMVDIKDKRKERTAVWLSYQGTVFIPPMEVRARVPDGVAAEDRDCP